MKKSYSGRETYEPLETWTKTIEIVLYWIVWKIVCKKQNLLFVFVLSNFARNWSENIKKTQQSRKQLNDGIWSFSN